MGAADGRLPPTGSPGNDAKFAAFGSYYENDPDRRTVWRSAKDGRWKFATGGRAAREAE
jgi:hypothetical protein